MGVEMIHWLCILYLEGQWRKLGKSLKDLNGFHPKIKFTYKKSKEKVNFLEVAVKIKNGRLNTDLYSKLVNNHQQHYYSLLSALDKYIIYKETLRLKRILSERKDLKSHVQDVEGGFLNRGYPQWFVEEQVDKVFKLSLEHPSKRKKENGIPLVVT